VFLKVLSYCVKLLFVIIIKFFSYPRKALVNDALHLGPPSEEMLAQLLLGSARLTVRVAGEDAPATFVDSYDVTHDHCSVLLIPKNPADRRSNLPWREDPGGYLIEKRLKQMVVCVIDQDNLSGRLSESLGGSQAAESSANDYDTGCSISHTALQ